MRKKVLLICIYVFLFDLYFFAQENNIIPGTIIAMVQSASSAETLAKEFQFLNGIPTELKISKVLSKSMNIYLLEFNSNKINQQELLDKIRRSPLVKISQFNHTFSERAIPNDTQFGTIWGMNNTGQTGGTPDADIDAPEAWNITTGGLTATGDTIVVAVIDIGFDLTHQDLNFWKNYDELPNNGIDDDGNGYIDDFKGWNAGNNSDNIPVQSHGTHVSGIIGAKGNNGIGVAGVNWNVQVMPIAFTSADESQVVAAYSYVRDQRREYNLSNGASGAFVVSTNSSFGVDLAQPSAYPLWCAMYDSLGAVGILSAAATANANYNIDVQGDIPTACESNWLVTVTNTTSNDTKSSQAGFGATSIDLGAPGTSILSTYPSNNYSSITGTSMATPHVAGAIALMYAAACNQLLSDYKTNPSAIALVIKNALLNATNPIAALNNITVTGGRLNLYNAVVAAKDYCTNGISEINSASEFMVINAFPNPTNTTLNLSYIADDDIDITVVTLLGQKVKTFHSSVLKKGIQHTTIELNDVSKGIYFINLSNKNKISNNLKIIIN